MQSKRQQHQRERGNQKPRIRIAKILTTPQEVHAGLKRYEAARIERASKMQSGSTANKTRYHLQGEAARKPNNELEPRPFENGQHLKG